MSNKASHFINGQWIQGHGELLSSENPATGEIIWNKTMADLNDVNLAMKAARAAFSDWKEKSLEERKEYLQKFKNGVEKNKHDLAEAISIENGKPLWEALQEVTAIIGKVDISLESYAVRCPERSVESPGRKAVVHHRPHGVIAVLGPFNFPGHLPHGHVIPALLAGNTVVFKPSELTPWVAEKFIHIWEKARLPNGVINLLQGDFHTGQAIVNHEEIDGLFFTGSWNTGQQLEELYAKKWGKILALEMGGNNPTILTSVKDAETAAETLVHSAYLSSGQRCSCTRRLIVLDTPQNNHFLEVFVEKAKNLKIGRWDSHPEPFMGPLISKKAAERMLSAQKELILQGGLPLLEMRTLPNSSTFLSPGVIDVTAISNRQDEEYFGPLVQLVRVNTFDDALKEASSTDFGLTAGLLSDREEEFQHFSKNIRAGILCWNVPTTNASSALPFGGTGKSGNFRPSAYYAADYCSYPASCIVRN